MQTSIDAAREARKPTESSRLAKAAALVAGTTLATLAGAAIAAGQPQGQMASDLATRDRDIHWPAARVSPNDLARAFATVLERPVRVETVPRESWEQIFRSQGTQNPLPRIRMLDGFNEGWIEFSVIAELVEASRAKAAA
jgi:hypothetical protein